MPFSVRPVDIVAVDGDLDPLSTRVRFVPAVVFALMSATLRACL
jgi:hypothetical protein